MFFDIGSNVGNWALANVINCDKIVAIEASPITFNKLVNNCNHNKIQLLNYAVCNNNGNDVTFYDADSDTLSTLNKDWLTHENSRFYNHCKYREIKVKTITIDKLIEIYGIPSLIKIDVEGGEFECISSLTQKVDLLCFEWASETNTITFQCLDYLFTLGFKRFFVQNTDTYTFRPNDNDFYNIDITKQILSNKKLKEDWGMLWCK